MFIGFRIPEQAGAELTNFLQLVLLNFSVDALVVCVTVPDQLVFAFFSEPQVSTIDLLHHHHLHVCLGMAWQIEVGSCGFHILVNIPQVFSESLSEAPVGSTNVLLPAIGNSAGDGIEEVLCLTVHLAEHLH